jgi:DNA-3-methyladenine glycosylase
MNVVTGPQGLGHAVLLRSARPIQGVEAMRQNRGLATDAPVATLLKGPGNLTRAMGIDKTFDGVKFNRDRLFLVELGDGRIPRKIVETPRIGITKAQEEPLRFLLEDQHKWVSRYGFRKHIERDPGAGRSGRHRQ